MPSRQSRGGTARAAALTPEERSAIAKAGAFARWGKKDAPAHTMSLRLTTKSIPGFKRLVKAIKAADKAMAELAAAVDALGKPDP